VAVNVAVTESDALAVEQREPLAVTDGDVLGDGLPETLSER